MVIAATYRALVVDDEAIVRQATMRALAKEGFVCQPAADGNEAVKLFRESRFDAVVTDLRMPNANGHSLAVEMLGLADRPVVVVLTGVDEPRLVKDLTIRGVDDIQLKPVNYDSFAKNLKSLVDIRARHREATARIAAAASMAEGQSATPAQPAHVNFEKVAAHQVTAIRSSLPPVPANFDAYRRASADAFSAVQLAVAIQEDPTLSTDSATQQFDGLRRPHTNRTTGKGAP